MYIGTEYLDNVHRRKQMANLIEDDKHVEGRTGHMDLGLKGQIALITGASKGLGKAIARELAQEGADVSICARGKKDLDEAATALRKYGVKVITTQPT